MQAAPLQAVAMEIRASSTTYPSLPTTTSSLNRLRLNPNLKQRTTLVSGDDDDDGNADGCELNSWKKYPTSQRHFPTPFHMDLSV